MSIKKVGIGKTDPIARLDVLGDIALTTTSSTIKLQGPASGTGTYILPSHTDAGNRYLKYMYGGEGTLEWAQLDSDKIFLGDSTISIAGETISMTTNRTERLTILPTGQVGIGTTQPQAKLNVAGDIALTTTSSTIKLQGPGTGSTTYTLPNDSDAQGNYLRYEAGGTLEWAQLDSDKIFLGDSTISIAGETISMTTNGTERLTILPNGNTQINGSLEFSKQSDVLKFSNVGSIFEAGPRIEMYPIDSTKLYGLGVIAGIQSYYVPDSDNSHVFYSGAIQTDPGLSTNKRGENELMRISGHGNVTVSGTLEIAKDLKIEENLIVKGDTITANVQNLVVEDPLIKLADGNTANLVDIGFYGQTGTTYTGLVRENSDENSDSKWYLFDNLDSDPTTNSLATITSIHLSTLALSSISNANNSVNLVMDTTNMSVSVPNTGKFNVEQFFTVKNSYVGIGSNVSFYIDSPNVVGGRLSVKNNGDLIIGSSSIQTYENWHSPTDVLEHEIYGKVSIKKQNTAFDNTVPLDSSGDLYIAGDVGIGNLSGISSKLDIQGDGVTSHFALGGNGNTYIRGGSSTSDVIISDNTRNVGIGTGNPTAKLEVLGDTTILGDININELSIESNNSYTPKFRYLAFLCSEIYPPGDSANIDAESYARMSEFQIFNKNELLWGVAGTGSYSGIPNGSTIVYAPSGGGVDLVALSDDQNPDPKLDGDDAWPQRAAISMSHPLVFDLGASKEVTRIRFANGTESAWSVGPKEWKLTGTNTSFDFTRPVDVTGTEWTLLIDTSSGTAFPNNEILGRWAADQSAQPLTGLAKAVLRSEMLNYDDATFYTIPQIVLNTTDRVLNSDITISPKNGNLNITTSHVNLNGSLNSDGLITNNVLFKGNRHSQSYQYYRFKSLGLNDEDYVWGRMSEFQIWDDEKMIWGYGVCDKIVDGARPYSSSYTDYSNRDLANGSLNSQHWYNGVSAYWIFDVLSAQVATRFRFANSYIDLDRSYNQNYTVKWTFEGTNDITGTPNWTMLIDNSDGSIINNGVPNSWVGNAYSSNEYQDINPLTFNYINSSSIAVNSNNSLIIRPNDKLGIHGKVGIGIDNPQASLDIKGDVIMRTKANCKAIVFGGSNHTYLSSSVVDTIFTGNDAFTIEGWLYLDSTTPIMDDSANPMVIYSTAPSSNKYGGTIIEIAKDGDSWVFQLKCFNNSGIVQGSIISSPKGIPYGAWFHFSFSVEKQVLPEGGTAGDVNPLGKSVLYINAKENARGYVLGDYKDTNALPGVPYIGYSYDIATSHFIGKMTNIRIWDTNLSQDVIQNNRFNIASPSHPAYNNLVSNFPLTTTNSTTILYNTVDSNYNQTIVRTGSPPTPYDADLFTDDIPDLRLDCTLEFNSDHLKIHNNIISKSDGDVGIGTNDPKAKLDVFSATDSSVGNEQLRISYSDSIFSRMHCGSDGNLNIWSNTSTNDNIYITSGDTGQIGLVTNKVRLGKDTGGANLTTYLDNNLTINTNSGNDSGSIVINQGSNEDIYITANGTGHVDINRLKLNGNEVTASASDLNVLAGNSVTSSDLSKLHSITASASELNVLDGNSVTSSDLSKLHSITASASDLNVLAGNSVTSSDLSKLHSITASASAINNAATGTLSSPQITGLISGTPSINQYLMIEQTALGEWKPTGSSTAEQGLHLLDNVGNRWTISCVTALDLGFSYNGIYKGFVEGNPSASGSKMNFTGQHRSFINEYSLTELENLNGLIVSANKNNYTRMSKGLVTGCNGITINESLPDISITIKDLDKSVFGVISDVEDVNNRKEAYGNFVSMMDKEVGDTRPYINSVGEGAVWVSDKNGNLESGDYITSCTIPGYGMRQDSEFLANYTVAKITMDCDFNPVTQSVKQILKDSDGNNILDSNGFVQWENHPTETEKAYNMRYLLADGTQITEEDYTTRKLNGETVYRAAFVGCTYHCG